MRVYCCICTMNNLAYFLLSFDFSRFSSAGSLKAFCHSLFYLLFICNFQGYNRRSLAKNNRKCSNQRHNSTYHSASFQWSRSCSPPESDDNEKKNNQKEKEPYQKKKIYKKVIFFINKNQKYYIEITKLVEFFSQEIHPILIVPIWSEHSLLHGRCCYLAK